MHTGEGWYEECVCEHDGGATRARTRSVLRALVRRVSRTLASHSVFASPLSESKRAWSGQVVVKEKLASGSTCATTLKLAVDVNGDFKGSERDRFILQGLSGAREFSEVASRERIVG